MELIGAFLTGVVGPVLYLIVNKVILKRNDNKRDKVRESLLDISTIDNELEDIREEFKSDRVWIAQFHNGGSFYPTGKSIQKFSIFYEVDKTGVSKIASTFNNIPCSLYPKTFDHLGNGDGIYIPDYNNPKIPTFGLKSAAASVGTKSVYIIPLFTFDGKFLGGIGMDYVNRKKKLSKDDWEHFQIKAGRISGYLSSYLHK